MELEELDHAKPYAQLRDLETIEGWAERNGIAYGVARAWAMKAVIPTLKVGKRTLVNVALLTQQLLEQEWTL